MKVTLFLISFLFCLNSIAQDSLKSSIKKYSFVKNEQVENVVYRGLKNPITIYVPNAKLFKANGLGLEKRSENKYYLFPDKGLQTEVKLEITLNNDSIVYESIFFRIKDIRGPIVMINDNDCEGCLIELSRNDLKNATLSMDFADRLLDFEFTIKEFSIIPLSKKRKNIEVIGNTINDEIFNILNKYKKGSRFVILVTKFDHNIKAMICKTAPIEFKIID
ncbi:hypothetical protein FIA58_007810 [Flavobacterium jejuense]|uniref:Gliding motility-associated protein GldM C-terminal domain-containing protein n=1 Tax=Flavobacterium jejuense TaxID=1544455 RepID=A0ABX0IS10_9FLAO|nr:GldM family protein [Flavobacterium jejuense]NHN25579.1 hypothetical protein [Flavobacterium jejuense]